MCDEEMTGTGAYAPRADDKVETKQLPNGDVLPDPWPQVRAAREERETTWHLFAEAITRLGHWFRYTNQKTGPVTVVLEFDNENAAYWAYDTLRRAMPPDQLYAAGPPRVASIGGLKFEFRIKTRRVA